jgi:tricorn protease-like protein
MDKEELKYWEERSNIEDNTQYKLEQIQQTLEERNIDNRELVRVAELRATILNLHSIKIEKQRSEHYAEKERNKKGIWKRLFG